jgi:predicted metal-dependent hydrolase
MQKWYKKHAISIFEERLQKCIHQSKSILELSQVAIKLKICQMKNRWGSCNNKGTINLNLELIKASIDCIDYVIMHELCHLKEMNYSKKFWQLLSQSMPDWERRKAKLSKLEIL